MRTQGHRVFWLLVCIISTLLYTPAASAHFKLNLNVRIIHVEHLADGLDIYLRLPMPYLVAQLLGQASENELPEPAPYTYNRMEDGNLVHFVDPGQLKKSPEGLGDLARNGLILSIAGIQVDTEIASVRVHPIGTQPNFATLDDAKTAFSEPQSYAHFENNIYVGDATVDVMLRYRDDKAVSEYALSSNLDPGLPDQDQTANLVLDYRPGNVQVYRVRGLMHEAVIMSHSMFDALRTFIGEGIKHILEGLDHVLFVICLVLGATHLKSLVWRVTGFTLGHSVTLTLGFFGLVPSGAWFVPAVETGIALSIIYAALIALRSRAGIYTNERTMFSVTSGIGLLHGLGFSFVLHKILQVSSPNIWQSLLAFNLGVEIGQLIIILACWPLFYFLRAASDNVWRLSRSGMALACILIASVWTVQRVTSVLAAFQ